MQIFVRGLSRVLALQVHPTDTLLSVKERVQDREGVAPEAITFTLSGKPLADGASLAACSACRRGATAHCRRFRRRHQAEQMRRGMFVARCIGACGPASPVPSGEGAGLARVLRVATIAPISVSLSLLFL